jgi:large subunit ribosomal protein L29
MAILRKNEIRKLSEKDIDKKIQELRMELAKERANINIGASATSPGRIRQIRKAIARAETLRKEGKGGNVRE